MTEFLDRNLAKLQERFPGVYNAVEKDLYPLPGQITINGEMSRGGLPNLKFVTGDRSVFIHSNYNPHREAEAMVGQQDAEKADTLIILGFGLGYHLETLIEKYPNKNKVVVEPHSGILKQALESRNLSTLLAASNLEIVM
ncbi:MAG TPA: hypothetical protein VHS59_11450, partial [Bacillota bacterium]|nr:hypothetical protein [Bacillota bacterium]